MQFTFDLISDLHIETWDQFDWTHQPTSPFCVVAGDVARDPAILRQTLTHLGECYKGGVFYIDGNDEHRYSLDDLGASYRDLSQLVNNIPNVTYMQDNIIIVNGVAIVATNGWWSYDMNPSLDLSQSYAWYANKMQVSSSVAESITGISYNDTAYVMNSVQKLQTHRDVKSIVIITHTVPSTQIIAHDLDLVDTWRYNTMGTDHMQISLEKDTEKKVKVWCFGHYHKGVDRDINGVRYVNNCRGRGDTEFKQQVYYPKRISIEI